MLKKAHKTEDKGMVPLWPLPPPHPGQICFVGNRNDPAGLGGVFVVTSAFKSFILKLDMGKSIFLNIFVQYCTLCTVQSKRKIFLSTCPSDKHYIKFGCPIPKRSYPKRFARFLSQMELVKTNEMVAV